MDTIKLYDIYDIWYEPPWFIRYKYWLLIPFVILLSGSLCYYFYKKKMQRKKRCWFIALEKLSQLDKENFINQKLFYFNLTDIIKNYLFERYAMDVLSKTDEEIIKYLDTTILPPEILEDLKKIFSGTRLIKFANCKTNDTIARQILTMTIRIVKNSIPKNT